MFNQILKILLNYKNGHLDKIPVHYIKDKFFFRN